MVKKLILLLAIPTVALAEPTSVTIVGSFQSELGCFTDWQPDCALTHLTFDTEDQVWQRTFDVPAGNWEYKLTIDDSWDENYGANAAQNGANIALNLSEPAAVKFYYSHETHWVTDSASAVIATAVGNFQSELGCPTDWAPDCLRSWLQDPDGDGVHTFSTTLPVGSYEVKVAIGESFAENYGAGGVPSGPNIGFDVPCGDVSFVYDAATHILTVIPETSCPAAAAESLEELITLVRGFSSKGAKPLAAMLSDALELLEQGDVAGATEKLGDALNFIDAQEGRKLTTGEANQVRAAITEILAALE